MKINHIVFRIVLMIAVCAMAFSTIPFPSVYAQSGDGIKRQVNAESGKISFIGPENGRVLPAQTLFASAARPPDPALALANRFSPEFGVTNPERDLLEVKNDRLDNGRIKVRYQQRYENVPVMGAELIVNTSDNGDLYSINGEVSPNLSLPTQPTIAPEQAAESALQAVAKWYENAPAAFNVSKPELWIFDESLLHASSTRPAELVWRMEVTPKNVRMPVRELVLVNAQRGNISLHFNQIDTAWRSDSGSAASSTKASGELQNTNSTLAASLIQTYSANHSTSLPGQFLCDNSMQNCTNGTNPDADQAQAYTVGTYQFYNEKFGRNSIDNQGMTIISTVQYSTNYKNAYWDGTQMVYGDGYGFVYADDVVAHELTHGVTQYESNLYYYYQSGAINESFSDLWGEYFDQTNGQGNDSEAVKWLLGEDVTGLTPNRSLSDPTIYGDPDKMTSPNYFTGADDNGGVHDNSGVNNKAVYLMVEGGTFNGKTVAALDWVKTAALYYEVNTNLLTSGADYSDLYYALQRACINLEGQHGITSSDCPQVKAALDAVEMNSQPVTDFNTDAPLCPTDGNIPNLVFADDLEEGSSNWTFDNGTYPRWQYDSPYDPYAQSGLHFLYADDFPPAVTDATATLKPIVIPANAYLHFAHAYDFEYINTNFYDGGVLEYSSNGGATWLDADSLFEVNGYNGSIYVYITPDPLKINPLMGQPAFVGASHGYISSRLNLASLAGQTVSFRWRMGLDYVEYSWGWWLDNVKVYTCQLNHPPTDISLSNNTINNNMLVGTTVGIFSTTDTNPGDTFVYSFCGGPDDASFLIAGNTLKSAAVFDYETKSSYNICVRSTDSGNLSTTKTFVINVAANSAPTNISLSPSSVEENLPAGTTVGTFQTSDPNTADTFTYSFCGGLNDASFSIAGNILKTAMIFDYEAKSSYAICVRTNDGNGGTFNKNFTISISDAPLPQTFIDVPTSYWAWKYIESLALAGITDGCSSNTFCPESPVTRAQMAVFLEKSIKYPNAYTPPVATPTFIDTTGHWAKDWIEALKADGITSGCTSTAYCPDEPVKRAQMAVFLLKATHGANYAPPPATGMFTDVPTTYWAAAWIERLAAEGITGGCSTNTYCPENPVTRAQMAVFLQKAFGLPFPLN